VKCRASIIGVLLLAQGCAKTQPAWHGPNVSSEVDAGRTSGDPVTGTGGLGGTSGGGGTDGEAAGGTADSSVSKDGGSDGAAGNAGDAASSDASNMGGTDAAGGGAALACPGLPAVTDYAAMGPFDAEMFVGVGPSKRYTLFRPDLTLGMGGFKHPLVAWGRAAPGLKSEDYETLLGHVASHGFLVISCDEGPVDSACLQAGLDWLIQQNSDGWMAGKLDVTREITMGHNFGAIPAMEAAAARANVKASVSIYGMSPTSTLLESMVGPLLLFGSTGNTAFPLDNRSSVYGEPGAVPNFYATLDSDSSDDRDIIDEDKACAGGVSCPSFGAEHQRAPIVAWLRLWLCGDQGARAFFDGDDCVLCRSPWIDPQRKPAAFWQ
jgi:hypothetical protein